MTNKVELYDSIYFTNNNGEQIEAKLYFLDCLFKNYYIGSKIGLNDGIYVCDEAYIVVKDNMILTAFDTKETYIINNYGEILNV